MTKKAFLDELNNLLKLLADDERQKIIKKYNLKIEKELKNGKSEAEIIESFGDLKLLATNILKDYKINNQYIGELPNPSSPENVIFLIIDSIVAAVKRIVYQINEQSLKKVIEIILYFVILLFFLFVLKIPFLIIEGLSLFVLSLINPSISKFFLVTFKLLLDVIYFLSIIYFLIVIYNHRSNLNKQDITVAKTKLKESSNSKNNLELATVIFQVFIIIITLPLLAILIFLFIILGLFLGLLIKGFIMPSLIIIIISFIIILGSIIGLIYCLVFKRKGSKNE